MAKAAQFPNPSVKLILESNPDKFEYEVETRLMQQYRVFGSPFWDGTHYCVLLIKNG